MKGIDVSKHQGPIDFNAVYNGGYRFVMVRMAMDTPIKTLMPTSTSARL